MKYTIIPVILIAILGLFFLGKGITGLVVSQSCCFETGANCAQENKCVIESPMQIYHSQATVYFGMMLVLVSALAYLFLNRGHHRHNSHQKRHK
jgi:Na+/H+ antiporter NhaC